ncbi:hypothetical protein CRENBAI_001503 [Crenichthys baileyi]|uniref:Uncharacterized protein n=1 Tax=Crenichthys baileyi TaxID=28760 RepID=A0AAV9QRI2_9TELE
MVCFLQLIYIQLLFDPHQLSTPAAHLLLLNNPQVEGSATSARSRLELEMLACSILRGFGHCLRESPGKSQRKKVSNPPFKTRTEPRESEVCRSVTRTASDRLNTRSRPHSQMDL